ncbi:hypothetical protein RJ55_01692 [Drechmeria coniospora]|nr:hypothetical protein RJ55_01692 [Drechmeria coniospora]
MSAHKVETMKSMSSFNDELIPEGSTLQSLKDCRMAIARTIFGELGDDVNILAPFNVTWGCNVSIGDRTYVNREVQICDDAPVSIGSDVYIGPGVCITTATHSVDWQARKRDHGTSMARPIRIGDNCWVGARATILPGVTIGRRSVVAAGAVVARDVEPEVVVGGVPARIMRSQATAARPSSCDWTRSTLVIAALAFLVSFFLASET